MNFIDALGYLYHNRISDEEFSDPFFLYCRLSDLCKSSYEDKRKVLLFYQVDKKINLAKAVADKDNSIESKYTEVADLLSEASFFRLVESIKCVIFPEYKKQEKPKTQPKKQATAQAVVTKAEEPQEEETRTPLTTSYVGGGDTDVIITLSIMGGVFLAILLFIVFACVFNWSWNGWQWLIGIGGGIVLSAILIGIVAWFDGECLADYYVLGTFVLGICVLLNFILLLIFKGNYKVIFGWFSGFEFIVGAILALFTCYDSEDGWGAAQIVEVAITIMLFIIAMICF